MWLGFIICERCYLVQRDHVSRVQVLLFEDDEYACGCARCGFHYARFILI